MIKLLHVEDDGDIREIVKLSLVLRDEFEVVQCGSGPDALGRLDSFTPDVILLDMMMPGMTGKEALLLMRERTDVKDTPAIFMTARAQTSQLEESRVDGCAWLQTLPHPPKRTWA